MTTRTTKTATTARTPWLVRLCDTPDCGKPTVTREHAYCVQCDADEAAHYFAGDVEGELFLAGISTKD